MDLKELQDEVAALKRQLERGQQIGLLIGQQNIIPGAIKNRSMGEPNTYILSGLAANRPTSGVKITGAVTGCSAYFATDTFVLSIWTGSVWKSVTLS